MIRAHSDVSIQTALYGSMSAFINLGVCDDGQVLGVWRDFGSLSRLRSTWVKDSRHSAKDMLYVVLLALQPCAGSFISGPGA